MFSWGFSNFKSNSEYQTPSILIFWIRQKRLQQMVLQTQHAAVLLHFLLVESVDLWLLYYISYWLSRWICGSSTTFLIGWVGGFVAPLRLCVDLDFSFPASSFPTLFTVFSTTPELHLQFHLWINAWNMLFFLDAARLCAHTLNIFYCGKISYHIQRFDYSESFSVQPVFTCSKLTIETLEQVLVLVFLLLTSNM